MKPCTLFLAALAVFASCNQQADINSYVPENAVMAHRGSTYWAPEETESAWRWAREMGADYLESDLQCTKDGWICIFGICVRSTAEAGPRRIRRQPVCLCASGPDSVR